MIRTTFRLLLALSFLLATPLLAQDDKGSADETEDEPLPDVIAVGWGGDECGVTAYRVGEDGLLNGIWGVTDEGAVGVELATAINPSDTIDGRYEIDGIDPSGEPYQGTLEITANDEAFILDWKGADEKFGVGVLLDDVLAASWGSELCGVAVYTVLDTGALDGLWSMWDMDFVRTEQLSPAGKPGSLSGNYDVEGISTVGDVYVGTLEIVKQEVVYTFNWDSGGLYSGVGVLLSGANEDSIPE
jgi:hypothetical protein